MFINEKKGLPKRVERKENTNTGIPSQMKHAYEQKSKYYLDDVKVHYNSRRPEKLKAYAFTQNNNIYLAPNQSHHLNHEMGHIIQQKQGKVTSGEYQNGYRINNNASLEKDANHIAYANYRNKKESFETGKSSNVIQCMRIEDIKRPAKFKKDIRKKVFERQEENGQSLILPQVCRVEDKIMTYSKPFYECRSCHNMFTSEAMQLGHIIPWKKYVIKEIAKNIIEVPIENKSDPKKLLVNKEDTFYNESPKTTLFNLTKSLMPTNRNKEDANDVWNYAYSTTAPNFVNEYLPLFKDSIVKKWISKAYSDIDNIDLECQSCNVSHDFEEDYDGIISLYQPSIEELEEDSSAYEYNNRIIDAINQYIKNLPQWLMIKM